MLDQQMLIINQQKMNIDLLSNQLIISKEDYKQSAIRIQALEEDRFKLLENQKNELISQIEVQNIPPLLKWNKAATN